VINKTQIIADIKYILILLESTDLNFDEDDYNKILKKTTFIKKKIDKNINLLKTPNEKN
jgi:hypothetical protein